MDKSLDCWGVCTASSVSSPGPAGLGQDSGYSSWREGSLFLTGGELAATHKQECVKDLVLLGILLSPVPCPIHPSANVSSLESSKPTHLCATVMGPHPIPRQQRQFTLLLSPFWM